jgi:hypothetical protein
MKIFISLALTLLSVNSLAQYYGYNNYYGNCTPYYYTSSFNNVNFLLSNPDKTCAYVLGENALANLEEGINLQNKLMRAMNNMNAEPWYSSGYSCYGEANWIKNSYKESLNSRIEECNSMIRALQIQQRRFRR